MLVDTQVFNMYLGHTESKHLFTKRERSLIFSALKKSSFLKSMLLPNFAFDVMLILFIYLNILMMLNKILIG